MLFRTRWSPHQLQVSNTPYNWVLTHVREIAPEYNLDLHCPRHFRSVRSLLHAGLLNKLSCYGISSKLCALISCFFSNRRISVNIKEHSSSFYSINAEVFQESVIARALFLLKINDLLSTTFNFIYRYAEVRSTFQGNKKSKPPSYLELASTPKTTCTNLSKDLEKVLEWGAKNRVQFNVSKSQACILSNKKSQNIHSSTFRSQKAWNPFASWEIYFLCQLVHIYHLSLPISTTVPTYGNAQQHTTYLMLSRRRQ